MRTAAIAALMLLLGVSSMTAAVAGDTIMDYGPGHEICGKYLDV